MPETKNTLWNHLDRNWQIKKSDIKKMGINPNKNWDDVTVSELEQLAAFLDITVGDFIF